MSRCVKAKITGVGGYVPPRILTNADLEKMVDTTDEWIMERVGIRERHLADKGVAASDLAVAAVKCLQSRHPFDLQEVDLIVVGTVTPDMMYPSTACLVQHKLGIAKTWGFDESAGGPAPGRYCWNLQKKVSRESLTMLPKSRVREGSTCTCPAEAACIQPRTRLLTRRCIIFIRMGNKSSSMR